MRCHFLLLLEMLFVCPLFCQDALSLRHLQSIGRQVHVLSDVHTAQAVLHLVAEGWQDLTTGDWGGHCCTILHSKRVRVRVVLDLQHGLRLDWFTRFLASLDALALPAGLFCSFKQLLLSMGLKLILPRVLLRLCCLILLGSARYFRRVARLVIVLRLVEA